MNPDPDVDIRRDPGGRADSQPTDVGDRLPGAMQDAGRVVLIAMKQEHRLVAELYRFIAPYIDTTKDIYVSLDGQAADTAVAAGRFKDPAVPDLWFTLVGASSTTLIEAKIIEDSGGALLMQSQLSAWRTAGGGAYKPNLWVASNRAFSKFYFWTHAEFLPILDNSKAQSNTLTLRPPASRLEFTRVSELALHVLRRA